MMVNDMMQYRFDPFFFCHDSYGALSLQSFSPATIHMVRSRFHPFFLSPPVAYMMQDRFNSSRPDKYTVHERFNSLLPPSPSEIHMVYYRFDSQTPPL